MKYLQIFLGYGALMGIVFLGSAVNAVACADKELVRSGEIVGTGKSVGFIVGARWGEGTVRLDDGRVFEFRVRGVKGGETGIANVSVRGIVYNLEAIEDFSGRYIGVAGGVTIANKGAGIASFSNSKCVTVRVTRDEVAGVQGSLPFPGTLDVEVTNIVQ